MVWHSWTTDYKFIVVMSLINFGCVVVENSPCQSTLQLHMELRKYRMWFLSPLVLLVMTVFFMSQLQIPWSGKWFNIFIGTDGFGAFTTYTKVLWALRPSLGKSYQNKKGNKTVEIWQCVSGKICAKWNTTASLWSWYCLANNMWISCTVYFHLRDRSLKYFVFSLS